MYPELYKCNSRESTFLEFCVDGINLFDENNFIDSLGLGRDSNPDLSALKPSECTTTPPTFLILNQKCPTQAGLWAAVLQFPIIWATICQKLKKKWSKFQKFFKF
jgi:hypothetical protein